MSGVKRVLKRRKLAIGKRHVVHSPQIRAHNRAVRAYNNLLKALDKYIDVEKAENRYMPVSMESCARAVSCIQLKALLLHTGCLR